MVDETKLLQEQLATQAFRLVRDAATKYRRTGNRLERAVKAVRAAERDHDQAARDLNLAIRAVQPNLAELPPPPASTPQGELPCCSPIADGATAHAADCPLMQT